MAQTHMCGGKAGSQRDCLGWGGGLGGGFEPEAARCGKTKRLHPWCTTCAHTRSRVSTARHEHRYVGPRQAPDVPDQPGTKLLFLLRSSANCHAKFTLAASGTLHAACGHCRSSAQGPRGAALHRGAPSRAPFCLKETNPFVRCARSVHLAPLETGRRAPLRHSRQAARCHAAAPHNTPTCSTITHRPTGISKFVVS